MLLLLKAQYTQGIYKSKAIWRRQKNFPLVFFKTFSGSQGIPDLGQLSFKKRTVIKSAEIDVIPIFDIKLLSVKESHFIFPAVMMKILRLLLTCIVLCCTGMGWVKAQILKGVVQDGVSGKAMPAVLVTNMHTGKFTYTDQAGTFSMPGHKGQKVSFAFSGYKTQEKIIPATLGGVAEMAIDFFPMSYELDEYVFKSRFTPYQLDSMERQQTYSRVLAREKGGSVLSPVSFLAEKLSGRSKQIFRFQKSFQYWETEKFIETRYTAELTETLTGLKGDTLRHFMNLNPLPYDFARSASDLELKMWIREKYRQWLEDPVYPPLIHPAADSTRINKP